MARLASGLLLVAFTSFSLVAQTPKLRLPGDVLPLRYELNLNLVPAADGYSGHISIEADIRKPVEVVWLNSTGLKLTQARVGSQPAEIVFGGQEFAGLKLAAPASPGKTRIEIDFSGVYSKNDVEGLFRQMDAGNAYVFTQFEPVSARRAFPCFDEPALKVPWKITLRVPKGEGAYANTPVESESESDGMRVIRFAETRPLPSYLVAVAAGPFSVAEGGKAGRKQIPVRILALKGRNSEAEYINKVTPKIIAALEEYFGQPYPYEKLDQVAIPITVGFGAMENAGLITYNQTLILARPDDDTIERQRRGTSTVTHELAHQWFGNMVTPAWWDDIWLNEAFATWMANRIVGKLFPEWNAQASAVESKATVMGTDQLVSARKIRQPIEEQGDISSAFDGITYQKGAAVIRMFENYVGPDRFQRGVRAYMEKYKWGNASASEFLAAISSAAGQDISPAFSKFLDRGGLPLLTVELQCSGKPALAVAQERSLPAGTRGARGEYWPVPVCLRWEAGGKVSRQCVLITDPKQVIELKAATGCPDWITANDEGTGYYHLLYKGDLAAKLTAHADRLSAPERVDLLRNAAALMKSGRMPAADGLALAKQLSRGPERQVILASAEVLKAARRHVPPAMTPEYARLLRDLYGDTARQLGWKSRTGENADLTLLRPELVELVAGEGDDTKLAGEALRLAESWIKDRRAVEPEMVQAVLNVAAHHGGRSLYERLIAAAKTSKTRRERSRIIEAVGRFRDEEIARSALGLMLTGDLDIRELVKLLEPEAFQQNPKTRRVPWDFVTTNYDRLVPRLPAQLGRSATSALPEAGAGFCEESGYQQVADYFQTRIRTVSEGSRALAQTLEQIQLCEAADKILRPELEQFFRQKPGTE